MQKIMFCIEIIDNFTHFGMHGKHYCSTFDIMGPNILDLMIYFENEWEAGIPIPIVKEITKQLLIGLDYMHRVCKEIHTDLKPENVMIQLPAEKMKDFEKDLSEIKLLPLSMKYLESIQKSKKGKKKRKKRKRKKKVVVEDE